MINIILSTLILLCSVSALAAKAVLIEEVDIATPSSVDSGYKSNYKKIQPLSLRSHVTRDIDAPSYTSALDLREKRRAGIGLASFGQIGMLGAMIELNFSNTESFIGQFGGGKQYNALAFQWKSILAEGVATPYFTLGYARWYSSSSSNGPISETIPSILAEKLLNDGEKASGVFAKDLFVPSLGVQYHVLEGEYVGSAVYAELVMIMPIVKFTPAPIASLGYLYYF